MAEPDERERPLECPMHRDTGGVGSGDAMAEPDERERPLECPMHPGEKGALDDERELRWHGAKLARTETRIQGLIELISDEVEQSECAWPAVRGLEGQGAAARRKARRRAAGILGALWAARTTTARWGIEPG